MNKSLIILITLTFASFTFSQSVEIKDGEKIPNILIQINDEGTAGSITIPDATKVTTGTTNKLYNEGGTLKWDGNALGLAGSAGGWTDDGTKVRLSNSSDQVGIGTSSPLSKLHIYDNTDGILALHIDNASTGTSAQSLLSFDNAQQAGITVFGASHPSGANLMRIYNNRSSPNGKIDFVVNGGIKMKINDDGKVGIGTTSPLHLLHVYGSESSGAVGHFENTIASSNQYGVYGVCDNTANYGVGGYFEGGYIGAGGKVTPNVSAENTYYGLFGAVEAVDGSAAVGHGTNYGVFGLSQEGDLNYGVYGCAVGGTGTTTNYGVYGTAGGGTGTNWAGYFEGRGCFTENVGIGTDAPGPNTKLTIVGLSEYADNAAAITGGLTAGDLYRSGDLLKIVH